MKVYIGFNAEKRTNTVIVLKKTFFKLMIYNTYGKTMKSLRKMINSLMLAFYLVPNVANIAFLCSCSLVNFFQTRVLNYQVLF